MSEQQLPPAVQQPWAAPAAPAIPPAPPAAPDALNGVGAAIAPAAPPAPPAAPAAPESAATPPAAPVAAPIAPTPPDAPEAQVQEVAPADEWVTVVVPKAFKLRVSLDLEIPYAAGVQEMPRAYAEHWYSKANKVSIYKGGK